MNRTFKLVFDLPLAAAHRTSHLFVLFFLLRNLKCFLLKKRKRKKSSLSEWSQRPSFPHTHTSLSLSSTHSTALKCSRARASVELWMPCIWHRNKCVRCVTGIINSFWVRSINSTTYRPRRIEKKKIVENGKGTSAKRIIINCLNCNSIFSVSHIS